MCRSAQGSYKRLEVIPLASTDIQRFEAEYTSKEANRKGVALPDTTPKIGIDTLPLDALVPNPTSNDPYKDPKSKYTKPNSYHSRNQITPPSLLFLSPKKPH